MLQAATRASSDKDRVSRLLYNKEVTFFFYCETNEAADLLYFFPVSDPGEVECSAGAWESASLSASESAVPPYLPAPSGGRSSGFSQDHPVRFRHEGQMELLLRTWKRLQKPCAVSRWVSSIWSTLNTQPEERRLHTSIFDAELFHIDLVIPSYIVALVFILLLPKCEKKWFKC